jgi:hypothetical protein
MKEIPEYVIVTSYKPDMRTLMGADFVAAKDGNSFNLIKSRETQNGHNVPTEEMLGIVEELVSR